MMRGFLGGGLAGLVTVVLGLGTVSLLAPQPAGNRPPARPLVDAPEAAGVGLPVASGEGVVLTPDPAEGGTESAPPEPVPTGNLEATAPVADTASAPAPRIEAGAPARLAEGGTPAEPPEDLSPESPVLPGPLARAPEAPPPEADPTLSTAPASPTLLVVEDAPGDDLVAVLPAPETLPETPPETGAQSAPEAVTATDPQTALEPAAADGPDVAASDSPGLATEPASPAPESASEPVMPRPGVRPVPRPEELEARLAALASSETPDPEAAPEAAAPSAEADAVPAEENSAPEAAPQEQLALAEIEPPQPAPQEAGEAAEEAAAPEPSVEAATADQPDTTAATADAAPEDTAPPGTVSSAEAAEGAQDPAPNETASAAESAEAAPEAALIETAPAQESAEVAPEAVSREIAIESEAALPATDTAEVAPPEIATAPEAASQADAPAENPAGNPAASLAEAQPAPTESSEPVPAVVAEPEPAAEPGPLPQVRAAGGEAVALPAGDSSIRINRPGAEAEEGGPEAASGDQPAGSDDPAEAGSALTAFAAPFANPEALPLLSVLVIDDGSLPEGPAVLGSVPFAVTIAIDPADRDAPERAEAWRAAGYEVVALARLPQGANPTDVEVFYEAAFTAIPRAVALVDLGEGGLQGVSALADQAMARLASDGRGFVALPDGLNMALRAAEAAGVPAVEIFRDLDGGGQDAGAVRRFLDNAAFRARQGEGVIVLARLRPETVSALTLWAGADRAGSVAIAPVSAQLIAAQGN